MTSQLPRWAVTPAVLGVWLLLKVHAVAAWVIQVNQYGDTDYYLWAVANATRDGSMSAWLPEYPTPAAWFLQVPYLLGATTDQGYRAAFMLLVSLVDLAFVVLLLRRLGEATAVAWIVLCTLAGQLALLRLDLVVAVLAAVGLLLVVRGRTPRAAPVLALGTAFKVWPILFFPLALRERGKRLRTTVTFAASGLVLAGVSVLGAGWHRLLSPLSYQAERGLQIEAVVATLPMVAWLGDPRYEVAYSRFKAYEVTGPGVAELLQAATVASLVAIVVVAGLLAWWFWRGCPAEAAGYLGMLMVSLFVATSRAYSPQYTLWIAALAVVLFGCSRVDPAEFRPGRAAAVLVWVAVLMLLTTLVYPTYYVGVVGRNQFSGFGVAILTVRNIGLLVLIAALVALIVDRLRGVARTSRPRRGPA